MNMEMSEVRKHVEIYFKEHMPEYSVMEVRRKSNHPDDGHLFMVSAKKDNGAYGFWSSWNEELQTLNHGHYNLKSVKDCGELFAEFQNEQHYFAIYKCSQNARLQLFTVNSGEDAHNFCEEHQWQLTDENGFVWDLDYNKI